MSGKVRVCHFTSVHGPGDTRIFVKECVSLANAGFEVFLVAVNVTEGTRQGVHIVNVPDSGTGRIHRMTHTAKRVYEAARKLDAAIYHFHDPELIPYAKRLLRSGKKVIYDVHEDIPRQILSKYYIPGPFRKFISSVVEKMENGAAKKFSWIVTATPFIRDRFIRLNSNVTDICNFPLTGELDSSTTYSERPKQLCYIGSVSKTRGIKEMVMAMENLPYKLQLCGEFSPPELRDEVMRLAGWKQVIEHGFCNREQVKSVLNSSRIGLVTLHPIINYADAYPVKMFEYMMAGIPVIASDIPLWKQIVTDTSSGICVDPLNPSAIREAIISLMENEFDAMAMGTAGRKAVLTKFNWKTEASKLIGIYKTLSAS